MAISSELLRRKGIHRSPEEFESILREAIEELPDVGPPVDPRRELTVGEIEALENGGFNIDPADRYTDDPVARTAAAYAALVASSLTVAEAAQKLGVDPSRIRQRLANRTLYGFKAAGRWRIPTFQFANGDLLPGIDIVVQSLDTGVHPLGIYNWFTLPDPDLELNGEPVSPRDWLRLGRSPAAVADIAGILVLI